MSIVIMIHLCQTGLVVITVSFCRNFKKIITFVRFLLLLMYESLHVSVNVWTTYSFCSFVAIDFGTLCNLVTLTTWTLLCMALFLLSVHNLLSLWFLSKLVSYHSDIFPYFYQCSDTHVHTYYLRVSLGKPTHSVLFCFLALLVMKNMVKIVNK